MNLSASSRRTASVTPALRRVCSATDWTVARVFFTRWFNSFRRSSLCSSACFIGVSSRKILTNSAPFTCRGSMAPLAQNRDPSLRRCQRLSSAAPNARAVSISCRGTPATRSASVKISPMSAPMISVAG
ncbi:hypothetical protein D3C80_1434930 [compost metagenome]